MLDRIGIHIEVPPVEFEKLSSDRLGEPGVWTGGGFGSEAGILRILARLAGILMIVIWVWRRYGKVRLNQRLTEAALIHHDQTWFPMDNSFHKA